MARLQQVELARCYENTPRLSELECLFQTEWADFKFPVGDSFCTELPLPIIALVGGKIVGGVAYTRYKEPNQDNEVIWLNAVFVRSEYRGQGIASQLIQFGISQMTNYRQSRLYAYTDVPAFYESLGWSVVDTESELNHKVMSISLKHQLRA